MKKPNKALVLAALLSTAGCYTYAPTPARSVEPGTDVKVHLDETQDVELASVTVRDVETVEGQFTRWTSSDDAVLFSTNLRTRPGVTQRTQGEMISIPEANIQEVDAPKFSGGRTAAVVVVGVGVVALIIAAIANSGNKGDQPGDGQGTDPPTSNLIKIPFSITR